MVGVVLTAAATTQDLNLPQHVLTPSEDFSYSSRKAGRYRRFGTMGKKLLSVLRVNQ
jgi:hypothetical protein